MNTAAWALLAAFCAVLTLLAWPLARWMHHVMAGRFAAGARVEAPLYALAGVRPDAEQGWQRYTLGLLVFHGLGLLAVYALQRWQAVLPLNPQALPAVRADLAFNTAVSFVTNTNWQAYAGEATMSPLTQMLALTVQNFLSAASGIVVVVALVRGFVRHGTAAIGNVWVDLVRCTLWILLPLALVLALGLAAAGVVQTLQPAVEVQTLAGTPQQIALGPVASQEAIKLLGTNGGGFFNANSAHPFENPSAWTNAAQMLAIFLIPAALVFVFGHMAGDMRQAWTVFAAMLLLFLLFVVPVMQAEAVGNPRLAALGADVAAGNLEGKETRFGVAASALFAAVTTAASCGAVNAMHDSFMPLGGLVPLVLMQLGEVVFGGVGSGLYGMLLFALLAVFIAGLMIGRTPEYLGKKIEAHEMQLVCIAVLVAPLLVLGGTALAVLLAEGRAGILNPGGQGFSEVLYAFSSAANNNGSAFAGLSADTPFYNLVLAAVMLLGRFGVIVPVLAIAGALAAKPRVPPGAGTMPTHGPLFVALLAGTVLLVGLLNHVPALALGPVVEHLQLWTR